SPRSLPHMKAHHLHQEILSLRLMSPNIRRNLQMGRRNLNGEAIGISCQCSLLGHQWLHMVVQV
ncbi:hypothetical protein, partial [Erythrobacter sp. YJ-T3-07]|uniref:hypothetical protein n=1 Tax=Erythrobacter sp. YJ-T3-07 TaxID=2793063 RepID=UPI001F1EA206